MATLLLAAPQASAPVLQGTVALVILCSPIRGANGAWRVLRSTVPPPRCLGDLVPRGLTLARIIVNGGTVPLGEAPQMRLQAGDEILLVPQWGDPFSFLGILDPIIVGLALSAGFQALSYVLFPPPKAHNIQHTPDEPSFSFEGIRTTVGPGAPVPVIYGRQRVGGQMLSVAVDQNMTVKRSNTGFTQIEAIAKSATLTMLLGIGEGPIHPTGINPASVQINRQPFANFPGVDIQWTRGTPDQTPLPYFGETAATIADGRVLPEDQTTVVYTTTQAVEAVVLNIAFNRGLYGLTKKGEKIDNHVNIMYRFRTPGGSYSGFSELQAVAARTSVVRFGLRIEDLPMAIYDFELRVVYISETKDAEFEPTLESVTEIQTRQQRYPDTALMGIRALATDQLSGALPNITVEVYGRVVRVGSFAAAETWSDNPAWCVMDFLTNRRYGLGVPDSEIDLGAFQAWADYCDQIVGGEKRHVLNYTLDRDSRAQQVLLEMAGGSRTLLFKSEGLWTPRPTRNDPPVQLLSWANSRDMTITYTRDVDRVNVMEARFANEDEDFEQDVLSWPPLDQWPTEVRKASLEIRGVTKPSRVMRALQFELARRQLENIQLTLTCSADALVLQPHDLFRFAHPLPGWGVSGRVQGGSSANFLHLDFPVTFTGPRSYIVYVRHENGTTEVRPVAYPGDITTETLTLLASLSQIPVTNTSLWAFGYLVPPVDSAVKVFRVVRMERLSDTTVRLQAVVHNPNLYDALDAIPLPVISQLFNPFGPPPPLTHLVLTEVTRIQASGASLRVVNISWDVTPLGPGLAPYGGALILRRTVLASSTAGSAVLGQTEAGELRNADDGTINFAPLTQVSGHVLDLDDYTVISGQTYIYRIVPVSRLGVPNNNGALEGIIHVAGPTTPGYFPGTVRNLRLRGQPPTATVWEGRDLLLDWDTVADSPLFSETFFVQDYLLEVWAPGQLYLLRRTVVPSAGPGNTLHFTYTLAHNIEDQIHAGQPGPRRDLAIYVWARTNTGRVSLDPAVLTVVNPAPDMSMILPATTSLFAAAMIAWDQFAEPRDLDHYELHLDTVSPPVAIYEDIAISFHGQGTSIRKVFPQHLTAGVTYYVQIWPYDTFGVGLPSQIASVVPSLIGTQDIHDEAIQADLIAAGAITTTKIADDAVTTPKLLAGAVISPKIAGRQILAEHLVTDQAVITVAAQIANAIIGDAHITSLAANKILAGTINVLLTIGVGNSLFIDGPNRFITVFDVQTTPVRRVQLGQLGAGLDQYGLRIWNSLGQLMWDFDGGAQTPGIAPSAVTTVKIAPASVTQSTTFVSSAGVTNVITETVCATVTLPTLETGDTVMFTFSGTAAESGGPNQLRFAMRQDTVTGTLMMLQDEQSPGTAACVSFQRHYVVPTPFTNKTFVFSLTRSIGTGDVSVTGITVTALRLMR